MQYVYTNEYVDAFAIVLQTIALYNINTDILMLVLVMGDQKTKAFRGQTERQARNFLAANGIPHYS
jgi:hypothetical protein